MKDKPYGHIANDEWSIERILEAARCEKLRIKEMIKPLEPLFRQAREKNTMFYSKYHGLYFSPRELKKYLADGKYAWTIDNWELRDRKEMDKFYTIKEVAEIINRNPLLVTKWAREGKIKSTKKGRRHLFSENQLEEIKKGANNG